MNTKTVKAPNMRWEPKVQPSNHWRPAPACGNDDLRGPSNTLTRPSAPSRDVITTGRKVGGPR